MMFECEADELEAEADATTRNLAILKVMNLDMWKDYALRFEAIGKHKAGFSGSFGAKNLQPFLTRHASKSAVSGGTHEDIQHRAKAIQELEMHNSEDSDGDCMHNHELDTISEGSEPAPVGEDEMVALKKLKVCIGEKDRRNLRAQFDMMDSEHDKIGMNEFLYACHSIGSGLLPNEITKVFRLIDTEGNGQVDFDDFIAGLHGFTKYIRSSSPPLLLKLPSPSHTSHTCGLMPLLSIRGRRNEEPPPCHVSDPSRLHVTCLTKSAPLSQRSRRRRATQGLPAGPQGPEEGVECAVPLTG